MPRVPGPMVMQCDHCTSTDYTEEWAVSRGDSPVTVTVIVCRDHAQMPIQALYNGGTKAPSRTVVGPKRGLSEARLQSLYRGRETAP